MFITVKFIDAKYMPYTTLGHWTYTTVSPGCFAATFNIMLLVAKMSDWRFEASVLIHELIEILWCIRHKVTTDQCDKFDAYYETMYKQGLISKTKEQGNDKRCPYHRGHVWGNFFSWLFEWVVGIDKQVYRREADLLMQIRVK
jgi:hypothetical protein